MACFIAPAVAAIASTAIRNKIPARFHAERLNLMLWGGVIMLIVDHIMSGEIVMFPPFLTAMRSPAEAAAALKEIATTGGAMTIIIFAVWLLMALAAEKSSRSRAAKQPTNAAA